jgi:hypothetical protein
MNLTKKNVKVHDVCKPYVQADVMREEAESALKSEYTFESLPILLHQVGITLKLGKKIILY